MNPCVLSVSDLCASPLAVCGSHHRAPGHQRQEPAVHRVCGRQQRQDPRQRALHRGGGRLVEHRQDGVNINSSIRSPVCQINIFISSLLHVYMQTRSILAATIGLSNVFIQHLS